MASKAQPAATNSEKMERAAAILKLLSHPMRIGIVDLLSREENLTVTDIYTRLEMPQANASQHLIALKNRGVLTSRRSGTKIYYSLLQPQLIEVVRCLEQHMAKL